MKLTYAKLIELLNSSGYFEKISLNYSYEDFKDITFTIAENEEETEWLELKSNKHVISYK
jgi:hypothetical protein